MRMKKRLTLALMLGLVLALGVGCAATQKTAEPAAVLATATSNTP